MYKDLYLKTEYEPLVPQSSNDKKYVWKFNSVTHIISWIQELDANFKRGSRYTDSDNEMSGGGYGFSLSKNLADAYEVVRKTSFDNSSNKNKEAAIRNVRRSTKFSDEGYEIEVPEFLAKSEKYWLEETSRRSMTRIIDDHLFINASYNWMTSAAEVKNTGARIIDSIYQRRLIPRKMVVMFNTEHIDDTGKKLTVFIDVSFRDLNSLAKLLHPSLFRRLLFRVMEIYPSLRGGYGQSEEVRTQRGVISVVNLCGVQELDFEEGVKTFLGVNN